MTRVRCNLVWCVKMVSGSGVGGFCVGDRVMHYLRKNDAVHRAGVLICLRVALVCALVCMLKGRDGFVARFAIV